MIPILYDSNETAFTSQGLGALADAVSASVQRVVNGKDELTLVYPSTGLRYADIINDRIIYVVPEYKKKAQPYQIYKITKPMNGLVTVYARHVGAQRASYIPIAPFTAGSLTEVLNTIPTKAVESCPFTFWTNKVVTRDFALSRPASLGNVLGGMEGSILDTYGGEYEFDGYTIKLWDQRGANNGVELRYGKNITDIEQSEDFASIVTGVVPYWTSMDGDSVYLPEIVVHGSHAADYAFNRTVVKDFSESFDERPTEAQLRSAAQSYLSRNWKPNVNLKVSFEHLAQYAGYENLQLLETVNLGDTVSIFYEPLNLTASARVAKTTYDCLNDKYTSVQIGSVRSDLEQVIKATNDAAVQAKEALGNVTSAVEAAVENATDLITGANGGYVILDRDANGKPFQILIMDTDDKTTATNVIRFNQNGIGFSTSGYSGPYVTAWTIDSNFVADFITTGVLNAALAKIGMLADAAGKNSWNMDTGEITITDGKLTAKYEGPVTIRRDDYDTDPNPVTNPDMLELRSIIMRGAPFSQEELDKYDLNGDGILKMSDLIKLRNLILAGADAQEWSEVTIDPMAAKVVRVVTGRYTGVVDGEVYLSGEGVFASDTYYDENGSEVEKKSALKYDGFHGYTNNTETGFVGVDCKNYIIEEGVSSGWNYRKWNNGFCEMWYVRTGLSVACTSSLGAGLYYGLIPTLNYPFTFASAPNEQITIKDGSASCWLGAYDTNTTTKTGRPMAIRTSSMTSSSTVVHYYVAGYLA